jgi:transposase-like protein
LVKEEAMAMDFPVAELMDEQACYDYLLSALHPHGLKCPGCGAKDGLGVHRRRRAPVLDYQCKGCGRVFNAFTGTPLAGTSRPPSRLVAILRGVGKGESTAGLSRELSCSRAHLLALRHRLQANAAGWLEKFDSAPLPDPVVEADEMYQNAGEKRREAYGPRRPAAAAGQQGARARHLGQRPPARARHRRP